MNEGRDKNYIGIDLDGTLLDVRKRFYSIYSSYHLPLNETILTEKEYWNCKRLGYSERKITTLCHTKTDEKKYINYWFTQIERMEYLSLDTLKHRAKEVLHHLTQKHHLLLVTMRKNKENVIRELENLNINHFFNKIISPTTQKTKAELLTLPPNRKLSAKISAIIGDTEEDIKTAKVIGVKSIAVCDGQRNYVFLNRFSPDVIVLKLEEVIPYV